jgi:hypothetical protein
MKSLAICLLLSNLAMSQITYTYFQSGPVLTFVGSIAPQPTQTIMLTGSGFGTQNPYNYDSHYLEIADLTGNWTAGWINNGNPNQVTLNVTSWTNTQIVIQGFTGAYGQNNWVLHPGDQVQVSVWNPQSGAGPASLTATVAGANGSAVPATINVVSGGRQLGLAGQTLAAPLVVEVLDAGGNPIPGTNVEWSGVRGASPAAPSSTTNANGQASVLVTIGTTAAEAVQITAGPVTTQVAQFSQAASAFAITNDATIGSLITDTNGNPIYCAQPPFESSFTTTDRSAGVWFTFNNGQVGDVFTVTWIHPSGAVDQQQSTITLTSAGSGCYAAFLAINPPKVLLGPINTQHLPGSNQASGGETDTGNWHVRVQRNGSPLFSLPFYLVNPVTAAASFGLTNILTTATPPAATMPCHTPAVQSQFNNSDTGAWVWFAFNGAQAGDVLSVNWVHPDKTIDSLQPSTMLPSNLPGCLYFSLPIKGGTAPLTPGEWYVSLLLNGSQIFSLPFYVNDLAPIMLSPAPGSTLGSSVVQFHWTPVAGATNYILDVSQVQAGGDEIFYGNTGSGRATGNSIEVPTIGATLYVRVYAQTPTGTTYVDATYKEATDPVKTAVMISPEPGAQLSGNGPVTFRWSPGQNVQYYAIAFSTDGPGLGNSTNVGFAESYTLTSLPGASGTLYVSLTTRILGLGAYQNVYTYKLNSPPPPAPGSGSGSNSGGSGSCDTSYDEYCPNNPSPSGGGTHGGTPSGGSGGGFTGSGATLQLPNNCISFGGYTDDNLTLVTNCSDNENVWVYLGNSPLGDWTFMAPGDPPYVTTISSEDVANTGEPWLYACPTDAQPVYEAPDGTITPISAGGYSNYYCMLN